MKAGFHDLCHYYMHEKQLLEFHTLEWHYLVQIIYSTQHGRALFLHSMEAIPLHAVSFNMP
jgi:hypothetical protein